MLYVFSVADLKNIPASMLTGTFCFVELLSTGGKTSSNDRSGKG